VDDIVLVVGAGTMGAGIALVAARGGYIVELIEPDAQARERGRARIEKDAERLDDPGSVLRRIRYADAIPARSEAALAIEAVPEKFELKRDVFVRLADALDPSALLATNTSSLSVAQLADVVKNPERVLGLHFFNPPAAMKLVEIVTARDTSDETIERARAFVERIDKSAVLAADTPGFIVNRVARPFYLQSMRALERGIASIEELDALARAIGFRMGPFELMDLIGIDVNLATTESVHDRLGAERLAPVALQQRMVSEGRLGRKSGVGFYEYRGVDVQRLDLTVDPPEDQNTDERVAIIGLGGLVDELVERIEQRYEHFQVIEHDDLLDEMDLDVTIVIDVGDGTADRGEIIAQLDSLLGPETVFFADAYATDLDAAFARMRHPERVIGYGVLGSLETQKAVEIVDTDEVSDDALEVAQEFFESMGKGVVLTENHPGLFLGRVVGSIVNEAMIAIHENVASAEDIDVAMRLGTNYPIGPIAWGREIGGARVARILSRVAEADGAQFAPHRSLWLLDVEQEAPNEPVDTPAGRPVL
jgi:3-hydroxybutyryl-CoA dehydrogenase